MRTMHNHKGNSTESVLLRGLCCFMVGLVALGLITVSLDDIGWTWDEVYYFESAQFQFQWIKALYHALFTGNAGSVLSQKIVDEYWLWDIYHNPHPPLYKTLAVAGWFLFKNILGDFAAFRLSSAFLAAVLISILYVTVCKVKPIKCRR